MRLLTPQLHTALRANSISRRAGEANGTNFDPVPLVKLFNPLGAATWLATELDDDCDTLFGLADLGFHGVTGVFLRLMELPDVLLLDVIAVVMGETIAAGSAAVDAAGSEIGVVMADWWQADEALFSLLRDRQVLGHIVSEVAGATIAAANGKEQSKTLKRIVTDHLDGADGRAKVERWVPRWMQFPPSAYTDRGGVAAVTSAAKAEAARHMLAQADVESVGEPFAQAA